MTYPLRKPSEVKIGEYTLQEVLERHLHWLRKDCAGWHKMRADLHNTDLHNVDLRYSVLCYVDLSNSDLSNADLRDSNFCSSNLSHTNLKYANFYHANLTYADFSYAHLVSADLSWSVLNCACFYQANLGNVNIHAANLYDTDLCDAKHIPYVPFACPSDGSFIAWKRVYRYLVKLEIPEDAKRCSGATNKCRADKAKVLEIYTLGGAKANIRHIVNNNYSTLDYIIGETVYPDSFDENRWNECSHGIHFFINKQDAINY